MTKEASKLTHIIVVGANAWGRGMTVEDALMRWAEQSSYPRRDCTVHLRQVDSNAYVDGMGSLMYTHKHDLPDVTLTERFIASLRDVCDELTLLCESARDAELV